MIVFRYSGVLVDAGYFFAAELVVCLLQLFFFGGMLFSFLCLSLGAIHLQLNQLFLLLYTCGASVRDLSFNITIDVFFYIADNAVQWTEQVSSVVT